MDPEQCGRLIHSCFPGLTIQHLALVGEGWSSQVWEVNGDYVFRFPKREEIYAGLRKEVALLPGLAPHLPLPVPRFDHRWPGGPLHPAPFVGYPRIPGVALSTRGMTRQGMATIATQLGQFLGALHGFPLQRALALGITAADRVTWRQEYQSLLAGVERRVFPLLDRATCRCLERVWQGFLSDEALWQFAPVLVHRDLCAEHILYDPRAGRITGIIDWEDAAIGDPAIDMTGILADCGTGLLRRVLAAYAGPRDDALVKRAGFYRDIGPVYQVLYGLDCGLSEHVQQGLVSLRTWARRAGG